MAKELGFNVNHMRRDIDRWFTLMNGNKPMYKKGPVAVTVAIQEMVKSLVVTALNITGEDRSGVRNINRGSFILSISNNKDLRNYFASYLDSNFNKSNRYENSVPLINKELKTYIYSLAKNIKITEKGFNILYFLISTFYTDIMTVCNFIMKQNKGKSFTDLTVSCAIQILLRNSNDLAREIDNRVKSVVATMVEEKEGEENGEAEGEAAVGEEEGGDLDGPVEEEEEVKTTKGKSKDVKKPPVGKTKAKASTASSREKEPVLTPDDDLIPDEPPVKSESKKAGSSSSSSSSGKKAGATSSKKK